MKQVEIGCYKQNCYIHDWFDDSKKSIQKVKTNFPKTYHECIEKVCDDGSYHVNVEEVEYPISEDTLNSYLDSTDYRLDPLSAVQNAPSRQNVGDVRELMQMLRLDSVDIEQAMEKLKQIQVQTQVEQPVNENKDSGDVKHE